MVSRDLLGDGSSMAVYAPMDALPLYKESGILREAFPVMAEAALFFVDYLEEKDGYLVTNPSVSPENTYILPNGQKDAAVSVQPWTIRF